MTGLRGEEGRAGGVVEVGRGGKSSREDKEGIVRQGIGFSMWGGGKPGERAYVHTKGGEKSLECEPEGEEGTKVDTEGKVEARACSCSSKASRSESETSLKRERD